MSSEARQDPGCLSDSSLPALESELESVLLGPGASDPLRCHL